MIVMNYQIENGILSYTIIDNSVCITRFEGTDAFLVIPEIIDGRAVCGIGRKAFLGNRSLQHIILPGTIEWIGDWAFGNCAQLRRVEFPCHPVQFGKGLFARDERLYEITCGSGNKVTFFPSRLLAVAVTMLDAEYMLDLTQVGCAEWYGRLDNRILTVLMESAENALKNLVYCAEEDMGAKQEACLEEQRRRKAYMALLRLAYPEHLEKETEEKLTTFLLDSDGLQTQSAWEAVKSADGREQLLFCDIILKLNGIREENLPSVLEDLGDTFVELKAYLLKTWEQRKTQSPVWERLTL